MDNAVTNFQFSIFKIILVIIFLITGSAPIYAQQSWPDFQTQAFGLQPQPVPLNPDVSDPSQIYNSEDRIGSLGFQIKLNGWPQLFMRRSPYTHYALYNNLGRISTPETSPSNPLPSEKDWVYSKVPITTNFSLYAGRITPTLVVDSLTSSLSFFGGSATPVYFATPNGIFPSSQIGSINLDEVASTWLLVWFGSQANFQATKFPLYATMNSTDRGPVPYSNVDIPILFVFQNRPSAISLTSSGLTFNFTNQVGKIAFLSLYGDNYPLASEIQSWSSGLPQNVKSNANWWSAHLTQVPLTLRESSSYNDSTDILTTTVTTTFLPFKSGGQQFAPISSMLSLASENGFPIQFSSTPVSTSVLTSVGPYKGIEGVNQYTYSITGLGKYVKETRVVSSNPSEPPSLQTKLQNEIQKVIDSGHLAPVVAKTDGYKNIGVMFASPVWGNPGETLYYLGDTLSLLDTNRKQSLLTYLQTEENTYPIESTSVLPTDQGSRREWYQVNQQEINNHIAGYNQNVNNGNFYKTYLFSQEEKDLISQSNPQLIPSENVYYLFEYFRNRGDTDLANVWNNTIKKILYPYLYRHDWATLGSYQWTNPVGLSATYFGSTYDGFGGVIDTNKYLSGLIGGLRFAYNSNDNEGTKLLWGEFAKTLVLRFAMDQYAEYLYNSQFVTLPTAQNWLSAYGSSFDGIRNPQDLYQKSDWMPIFMEGSWEGHLYRYNWITPEDDPRSFVSLSQFGVHFNDITYRYAGKLIPAYLGIVPEIGRFLADYSQAQAQTFMNAVSENMPDWYMVRGRQVMGAESNYEPPQTAYQLFLARSWILREQPSNLASYLDVAFVEKGDLYYIHKLAEVIRTYRGYTWQTIPGFPSSTCTLVGDIDCSGVVNVLDLSTLIGKFGGSDALADLDNSGKVNVIDLSILLSNFGRSQ